MRKTYCTNCKKIWEEPRDIPLNESSCPNCGKAVIEKTSGQFKVGQRVKFIEQWDIFNFDIIRKGETGTIVGINDIEDEVIRVKLDKEHPDLEEWNNEGHIYSEERKPEDYIKVI